MMAFGLTTELPRDREGHTYLVKKLTNCTYEVTLTGPDKAVMVYLDFSGLHHYSARQLPGNPKLISITMEGKNLMIVKEKGSGKKLGREDAFTNFADQPPDRLEAAASYFRSNFCKGRAF